ncbi:MAG: glycosyltransferase family 2 protein [Bacteroidota bacterium]
MNLLTSIIIPTYNRSHLLGATLDSVIKQTYLNWECIVVDDGSTDYTAELMEFYCAKDKRIKFHYRPKHKRKGANPCRNYGFELSSGNYIQWFDSDDLMVPEFLDHKVQALELNDSDFVISKTVNFLDPNPENILGKNEQYYRFEKYEVNNYNYIKQYINWLTPDFLAKREICEKARFNEKLSSSQEYNFFCQLTCFSTNAIIIDKYLTKRRIHKESVRGSFNNNPGKEEEREEIQLRTWKDVARLKPGSDSEKYFLNKFININDRNLPGFKALKFIFLGFLTQKRYKSGFYMLAYTYVFKLTGKGHFLRRGFIESLSK